MSMTIRQQAVRWQEGRRARRDGEPRKSPYPTDRESDLCWLAGYDNSPRLQTSKGGSGRPKVTTRADALASALKIIQGRGKTVNVFHGGPSKPEGRRVRLTSEEVSERLSEDVARDLRGKVWTEQETADNTTGGEK